MELKELMTIKETMAYLGVTRQCLFNWSKQGMLNRKKIGGKVFYKRSDLNDLIN